LADTDGDGLDDGEELAYWGINWSTDYDSDGLNNLVDPDADNDGANDGDEIAFDTDPTDPMDFPTVPGSAVLCIRSDSTDGNAVFTDSSLSAHTVTPYGNVQHNGSALFGSTAITYDGAGDYLGVSASPDWNLGTGDFTIALWVYFDSAPDQLDGIISTYKSGGSSGYLLAINNGHIQWTSVATSWVDTGVAPTVGQWIHVAVVRSGNTLTIYVNGNAAVTRSCAGLNFNSANSLVAGRYLTTTNGYYFKGYMDDITLCKGTALWTANFTPPNNPVVP
jgi:hypothetical protein